MNFVYFLLSIYLHRYLMKTINETGESQIIKEYNLLTRKWESSPDTKQFLERSNEKTQSKPKLAPSDFNDDRRN